MVFPNKSITRPLKEALNSKIDVLQSVVVSQMFRTWQQACHCLVPPCLRQATLNKRCGSISAFDSSNCSLGNSIGLRVVRGLVNSNELSVLARPGLGVGGAHRCRHVTVSAAPLVLKQKTSNPKLKEVLNDESISMLSSGFTLQTATFSTSASDQLWLSSSDTSYNLRSLEKCVNTLCLLVSAQRWSPVCSFGQTAAGICQNRWW